jgi:hypothetical protein
MMLFMISVKSLASNHGCIRRKGAMDELVRRKSFDHGTASRRVEEQ